MPIRLLVSALALPLFALALAGCSGGGSEPEDHSHVAFDVSPSERSVVFSSADGDLYLLDLESRGVTRLTETPEVESTPAFSPDGRYIAYVAEERGRDGAWLYVRSMDDGSVRRLTADPGISDSLPTFSPDGLRIAFARGNESTETGMGARRWHARDVYEISRDGGDARPCTFERYLQIERVSYSADGASVYYGTPVQRSPGKMTVTVVMAPVDGSAKPVPVTSPPADGPDHYAWATGPWASRDGRRIVFVSDRAEAYQYDIYILDLRDGSSRPLGVTSISSYNQSPVFAPRSRRVYFLSATEHSKRARPIFSLWRVGEDGEGPEELADSGLFADPLGWSAAE